MSAPCKPKNWQNHILRWMADIGLPANERWLYRVLAEYWNPERQRAWPGLDRLARETGFDKRSVRRLLRRLEQRTFGGASILHVDCGNGRRRTSEYDLLFFKFMPPERRTDGPPFDVAASTAGCAASEKTGTVNPDKEDRYARKGDHGSRKGDSLPPDPVAIRENDPVRGSDTRTRPAPFKNGASRRPHKAAAEKRRLSETPGADRRRNGPESQPIAMGKVVGDILESVRRASQRRKATA